MPLVDGESLRDRMNRERPMSIEDTRRILEEVAGALEYAHSEGIVHRDIKPENVMFFHDRAVVLDFGIGKAVRAASDDSAFASGARITLKGTSLGTPMYVSPEQAAGDPDLDHRADIYSLGVVAYEMLCGHPPFTARSPQMVFAAHASQAPQPISERRDVPEPLARIVMQCLAKSPNDRPQSAGEVGRALRGTLVGAMPVTRATAFLTRIPLWVPWVIALISTVAALTLWLR
jgi:serine/threonine-protein kinase